MAFLGELGSGVVTRELTDAASAEFCSVDVVETKLELGQNERRIHMTTADKSKSHAGLVLSLFAECRIDQEPQDPWA